MFDVSTMLLLLALYIVPITKTTHLTVICLLHISVFFHRVLKCDTLCFVHSVGSFRCSTYSDGDERLEGMTDCLTDNVTCIPPSTTNNVNGKACSPIKGGNEQQCPPPSYGQPPVTGNFQGQPAGMCPPQPGPQAIIVTQPVAVTATIGNRPPDYLIPSIAACAFCFWPTGLAAVYYAWRANDLVKQGDMAGAQAASKMARILMIVSIVVGAVLVLLIIILVATTLAAVDSAYDDYENAVEGVANAGKALDKALSGFSQYSG